MVTSVVNSQYLTAETKVADAAQNLLGPENGMGCAASKPLVAEREEANTLDVAAKPPTAGSSAGAAAIVKQEQEKSLKS